MTACEHIAVSYGSDGRATMAYKQRTTQAALGSGRQLEPERAERLIAFKVFSALKTEHAGALVQLCRRVLQTFMCEKNGGWGRVRDRVTKNAASRGSSRPPRSPRPVSRGLFFVAALIEAAKVLSSVPGDGGQK